MTIVINARFLGQPITGTQRFAIELCRGVRQLLPPGSLHFVSPDNIIQADIADEFKVEIIGRIKTGILWEQFELPLYLRRQGNPLLINLCNLAPVAYANSIVSVLDLSYYHNPEWFSWPFRIMYNTIIPRAARQARRVLTISDYSRQDIARHFAIQPERIEVVYPSLSPIFLDLPASPGPNHYGRYVLAVSSLDPRKNFKGLIQAFKQANMAGVKLVIVGAGHKVFSDHDLKDLVQDDPAIVFTGYVNDTELIDLYRHAALFAYPSFLEGFGIPPLEAMACGCPTLVSDKTSLPEVCGNASVYVDPYDVSSISRGLVRVLTDASLRQTLIRNGYEQVKQYDWQQSAQKMTNLILELTQPPVGTDSMPTVVQGQRFRNPI